MLLILVLTCSVVLTKGYDLKLGAMTQYPDWYYEEFETTLDDGEASELSDEDLLAMEQEQAEEESKLNATVWLTKSGKCYHVEGCSYLKSKARSMTQKQAIDEGIEPCSRCITSFWLPKYYFEQN